MAKDLTSCKFGRLTAISRVENNSKGHTQWLCHCDCGGRKIAQSAYLNKGTTRSCGCLANEQRRSAGESRITEYSRSQLIREYKSWDGMISRCYNPSAKGFENYGGRGIKVCPEWKASFKTFAVEMGKRPDNMTLDRIDNALDYSAKNCRWATRQEQANNRRNNRFISIDGQTLTVAQWARKIGVDCHIIRMRLSHGMNDHDAVMNPVRHK